MSQNTINIGTLAGDRTGDSLRTAGQKINANFTELYGIVNSTALPVRTGNNGKALFTDGTAVYWAPVVATNGVVTTGSYADPAWITSLAYGKITNVPNATTSIAGVVKVDGTTISINNGVISATPTSSSLTNGSATVVLSSGGGLTFPNLSSFTGTDFYAAPGNYIELASNNDQNFVGVDNASVYVQTAFGTGNYTWTFGTNGNLIIPKALAFSGSTSGSVSFQAGTTPAVQTYTLPNTYPVANNYVLASSSSGVLSWILPTGSGTVTSVTLALPSQFNVTIPTVTTFGNLTADWNTQTANKVLAGPTTGSAAAPTFRSLVASDIPSLSYIPSTGAATITDTASGASYTLKVIGTNGTGSVFGIGTGSNAYGVANDALNNTITGYVPYTLSASTVTFKAGTVPATALSIASNGAVTIGSLAGLLKGTAGVVSAATSGTDYAPGTSALATGIVKSTTTTGALTIAAGADINTTFGSQTQNYVYAAPSVGAGNPSFRLLTVADMPILGLQSRSAVTVTTGSLAYQASSTITVPVAKGYALYLIQSSVGSWVTIYTNSNAMTSDSARSITTDPTPGSGVVAESVTTGASTTYASFSPAVIGYNLDSPVTTNLYLKVYNNSGSTNTITITLTYIKLEV